MKPKEVPLLGLINILLCFLVSLPVSAQEHPEDRKSLKRVIDQVLLTGEQMTPLLGNKIDHMTLFRYHNKRLEAIPFQIDERDKKGEYILTQGDDAAMDGDKGRLDENDELAFMAQDLGGRAATTAQFHPYDAVMEIEALDPLTNEKGWGYLVVQERKDGQDDAVDDYIQFKIKNNSSCVTNKYSSVCMDYSLNYMNHLSYRYESGAFSPNMLDRMKLRLHFQLKKYLTGLSFRFDEESFDIALAGYKDGPVRVIDRVKHRINILGYKVNISEATTIYGPNCTIKPFRIDIPVNTKLFFSKATMKAYFDLNHEMKGMFTFFSDKNRQPFLVDGKMSTVEKQFTRDTPLWMSCSDTQGLGSGILLAVKFGPGFLDQMQAKLYYRDDQEYVDPPEEEIGQSPGIGLEFDVTHIKKGTYNYAIYIFSLEKYRRGGEDVYLNVLEHPLQVKVKHINISTKK